jgi:hypothetical protein
MSRVLSLSLLICATLLGTACSLPAPRYSPALENTQKLKDAGDFSAAVGKFGSEKGSGNNDPISLRGGSLVSPYGSYAEYLAAAVRQELELAGKLAPAADLQISGVLLKNDIDIAGFSKGNADLSVRFAVRKAGQTLYEQVKTVHTEWDSSFLGAVAIPRGQQQYPLAVQQLLGQLFADPAFIAAVKGSL